jgi:preprotein translocase subunit SecE
VAWKTSRAAFRRFAKETVAETKKVVWPSRKETLQTTGIVFAFVVIMAVSCGLPTRPGGRFTT